MKIVALHDWNYYRIDIDGITHVQISRHQYTGCFQTWFERSHQFKYSIEVYLKTGIPILLEYDSQEKWMRVIEIIKEF